MKEKGQASLPTQHIGFTGGIFYALHTCDPRHDDVRIHNDSSRFVTLGTTVWTSGLMSPWSKLEKLIRRFVFTAFSGAELLTGKFAFIKWRAKLRD